MTGIWTRMRHQCSRPIRALQRLPQARLCLGAIQSCDLIKSWCFLYKCSFYPQPKANLFQNDSCLNPILIDCGDVPSQADSVHKVHEQQPGPEGDQQHPGFPELNFLLQDLSQNPRCNFPPHHRPRNPSELVLLSCQGLLLQLLLQHHLQMLLCF